MDDGNKTVSGFDLNTYGFSINEVNLLSKVLFDKFGLINTVQIKKSGPILYISSKSLNLFKDLVRPHFHDSMLYKLK